MENKSTKNCIVVNLMGGPGTGKSILAGKVFVDLKLKGVTCDVSWEYIKQKIREKALKVIQSQIYIFGKQQFKMFTLKDEVEVIVTDSPLLLSSIYDKENCSLLKGLILKEFNKYNNLNYYIERDETVPYETEGRYQDLNGAKEVDIRVKQFLADNDIDYTILKGIGKESEDKIITDVLAVLGRI